MEIARNIQSIGEILIVAQTERVRIENEEKEREKKISNKPEQRTVCNTKLVWELQHRIFLFLCMVFHGRSHWVQKRKTKYHRTSIEANQIVSRYRGYF